MVAIALALSCAAAYGCADFLGGLASRHAHVLRVVAVAAPASLVVELLLWPVLGATWSAGAVTWGLASGLASAAAFAFLYGALALGPMSVLAPVTAVVSAVLPVLVGFGQGERLGPVGAIGLVAAVAAVLLVSSAPGAGRAVPSRRALLLALAAGAAIAAQLIALDQSPDDSGIAPLLIGRATSSALILGIAVARRRSLGPERPRLGMAAAAGALDSLANLAFLLAAREGDLVVVAVLTALYPAVTVVLARLVLGERLHRTQYAGLAVAASAVVLLAAG